MFAPIHFILECCANCFNMEIHRSHGKTFTVMRLEYSTRYCYLSGVGYPLAWNDWSPKPVRTTYATHANELILDGCFTFCHVYRILNMYSFSIVYAPLKFSKYFKIVSDVHHSKISGLNGSLSCWPYDTYIIQGDCIGNDRLGGSEVITWSRWKGEKGWSDATFIKLRGSDWSFTKTMLPWHISTRYSSFCRREVSFVRFSMA